MSQEEIKLITRTKRGTLVKVPAKIERVDGRIYFLKSPFALKDEIKAMKGSRWHGFMKDDGRKIWSVEDCTRNRFQLEFMQGGNPYANWDQPLKKNLYGRPLFEHQILMSDHMLTYHYKIIAAEMGCGKASRYSTPVLTPSGWSTIGSLEIDDKLIDPDGGYCEVVGLYPQGKKEIFKVTFTDGSSTECTKEHLWRVITPIQKWKGKEYQVLELKDIVAKGLQDVSGNNKWFIPMTQPVDFYHQKLKCHPYVLGYILGNGHLPQYTVSIPDNETVERLNSFMGKPLQPKKETIEGNAMEYIIKCPKTREAINYYNLRNCLAADKFVPDEFLYNTFDNRLFLLQGLLDSDGYAHQNSGVEFVSVSNNLVESVKFLIQSFGGTCHVGNKEFPTYTYKGESRFGQPAYRLFGSFWYYIEPFLLSRKSNKYKIPTKYQPTRAIVSVESVGFDEAICIKVNSKSRCYITDEFIVTHNTLSAIEAMEKSKATDIWWVGPKSAIAAVEREFDKWGLRVQPKLMTYDRLRIDIERWEDGMPAPQMVIFDESSRLKTATSKRTKAAQHLADSVREEWGWDGYVILMSGTPSPKSPVDWFSQCEICYPGFIREGSTKAFERRLGIFEKQEMQQNTFFKRVTWRDDENKCDKCGKLKDDPEHQMDDLFDSEGHEFTPSKNEVAYLYKRLDGLVLPLAKKDCLDIPDKIYREVILEPSNTVKRAARSLVKAAPTAIQGLTWLRELSDGFQYRQVEKGKTVCPVCKGEGECEQWSYYENEYGEREKVLDTCQTCHGLKEISEMVREAREVKTPKDIAVRDLLEENEEQGRIVIFAGFQGSIDRVVNICHKQQWNVLRVDGRGWKIQPCDGKVSKDTKPLNYWGDMSNERVAFVAHPMSGGMGLTLTEARMAVFYSNDFNPESRSQAEDRIHRPGIDMNKGATIVDLFHLGVDRKVRDILLDNRRLENMTLGEIKETL